MSLNVPVHFERDWIDTLDNKIKADGPWDFYDLFQLALQADKKQMIKNFNHLSCIQHLTTFTPLPHQINTAQKVLNDMHGKAILADEVGLGKTIEAGLVLKEYMLRGLVKKALILVPASLVLQWTKELNEKFAIPAVAQKKAYMWTQTNILVASIDTAKRPPHRDDVLAQQYDMLIVDEAHKLKNSKTKNYEFMTQLQKKYCLLLTATPIQNSMIELFHLVSLLKPGLLGDPKSFQNTFIQGKRKTKNQAHLNDLLQKVMIRNRRQDGGMTFSKRHVQNISLQLSDQERQLYDAVTRFARDQYQNQTGISSAFSMITLQREVCSSRESAFMTLYNMIQKGGISSDKSKDIEHLLALIKEMKTHTKTQKVVELIQHINDKVIVFTEYRATQSALQKQLSEHGITSVLFRGGFKRNKKDWMTELFRTKAQVLIATEAGGEGVNLQFCNHIINYDLPWNPMRVEQRIGRVHRIGQEKDVYIYNLTMEGTIEQYILHLLYEKIRLFEMVIGELDQILDKMKLRSSLEDHLSDIFLDSSSSKEIEIKLENVTQYMQTIREDMHNDDQKELPSL